MAKEQSTPHSADEYRVEFDETGGSDCMTGGFAIVRENGDIAVVVDLRHYGQEPCEYEGAGYVDAKERAEAIAHRLCAALNAPLAPSNDCQWPACVRDGKQCLKGCRLVVVQPISAGESR